MVYYYVMKSKHYMMIETKDKFRTSSIEILEILWRFWVYDLATTSFEDFLCNSAIIEKDNSLNGHPLF